MNPTQTINRNRHELFIALCVFLACVALVAIDKDTKSWSDVFDPSNIVALFIYFTPTYILTCLLYPLFASKNTATKSISLSLIIGVPAGFTLIILFFVLLRHS